MVAVQAENGSTNLAGMRSPGIGPDGRLVQMSAKIPLRGCEPLGFRRWVANKVLAPAATERSRVAQNKFLPKTRDYCTPLLLAVPHWVAPRVGRTSSH